LNQRGVKVGEIKSREDEQRRLLFDETAVPENMGAIEAAILGNKNPEGQAECEAMLRSQGLMPADWDIETLLLKVWLRVRHGECTFGSNETERRAQYERLKHRPSVQRVPGAAGFDESSWVINTIEQIDKALESGKTYQNVLNTLIYDADIAANEGFLNHVEEKFGVQVKTTKQLSELTGITEEELSSTLEDAFESRYFLALYQLILDGGMYADLIALKPSAFGLPEEWETPRGNMNQEKVLARAIGNQFLSSELSVREIAKELEAPYGAIMKITKIHEHERELQREREDATCTKTSIYRPL
jgi:hypothetical protein